MTTAKITAAENRMKAMQLWQSFNVSERVGCRFGMFPFVAMQKAEQDGFDPKLLVQELMNLANNPKTGDFGP